MGQKLKQFFELAKANGGMQTQMRLAMKTGIPSVLAEESPDSAENLAKFKAAFKEITGKEAPIY